MVSAEPIPADLGITHVRDHLADIVNKAAYAGTVTYISRHGRRLAAIVPAEDALRLEQAEVTARRQARENAGPERPAS